MFVFAFPLFPYINSIKFALIIVTFLFLVKKNLQIRFFKIIRSKRIIYYLLIIFIFSFYTLLITILNKEFDFSLFYKQISSLFLTLLSFLFFVVIDKKDIDKIIINAFVFQSILIIIAILSKDFYEYTSFFRFPITAQQLESYGRFRGNAISGYQFYGIGVMYGFIIIYFALTQNLLLIKNLIIFILITIVGIISSRLVIFAFIMSILFWFFFISSIKSKIRFTILFLLFSLLSFSILKYSYYHYLGEKTVRVINYQILLPLNNLIEKGELNASSVDKLTLMYKKVHFNNILFGDGRYVEENGRGYYGNVDAGYLRMIYYYGIFGLLILILIQILFIFNLTQIKKSNIMIMISFFFYFLLINIKGDVFYFSNNTIPLIVGLIYFKDYVPTKC